MNSYIRLRKFVANNPEYNYLALTYIGKDCNHWTASKLKTNDKALITNTCYIQYSRHKTYEYLNGRLHSIDNFN